jgi:hypothetical protein
VSSLAAGHHSRRNRRLAAVPATGMQSSAPGPPCPDVTGADLGIPAKPPAPTTTAADPADPVCGHHASGAEAASPPPRKTFVQLHDIK